LYHLNLFPFNDLCTPQIYVDKVDGQLVGLEALECRNTIDTAYDSIIQAMFDSLQQMAKMDGAEAQASEDKGMLNYHVTFIGE